MPNPSFEEYIDCPDGHNQLDRCEFWTSWSATADYHNACSPGETFEEQWIDVPSNLAGYQLANSGDAYAGFEVFPFDDNVGWNVREIVGAKLIDTLEVGCTYSVKYYVSRGDSGILADSNVAIKRVGIRFTCQEHHWIDNPAPISNWDHVSSNSFLIDTVNWMLVEDVFIADSAYTHIGIGHWFDDESAEIFQVDTLGNIGAYYYVDDVLVEKITDCTTIVPSPDQEHFEFTVKDDLLRIIFFSAFNCELYLYDLSGRLLAYELRNDNEVHFPLYDLSPQILVLTLRIEDKFVSRKFVNH